LEDKKMLIKINFIQNNSRGVINLNGNYNNKNEGALK
tara:strand:+ start:53 stop:163 length:111 start_codon:yes stop_codon:yes gene_type:complete